MRRDIRRLTIGESPKAKDAFHYQVGSPISFYSGGALVEGILSKITFREDLFHIKDIRVYEIFMQTRNPVDEDVKDTLLWKDVSIGKQHSAFVEYNLNY